VGSSKKAWYGYSKKLIFLDELVWYGFPYVAFPAYITPEFAKQLITVETRFWKYLLHRIFESTSEFGTKMINDFFNFDPCHV
jgi:hypothetical protein